METIEQAYAIAAGVVGQLSSPQVSVYWVYLLGAVVLAIAAHIVRTPGPERFSVLAWVRLLAPRTVWTHRSARHDLAIFVLNTLLYSFLLLGPLQAIATAVYAEASSLLPPRLEAPLLPSWAARGIFTLAVFVAADFAFFVSHLAMHRIGVLWEFHKIHHSAPVLQPFTVFRRHPVDVVIEGSVSGFVLGTVYAVTGWAIGAEVSALTILGTNAALFVCLLVGFNLQHSHIWLSFGPLDAVFISPATHQLHHSTDRCHHDRNFGNMLAIWDRMAGTLIRPCGRPNLTFGLCTGEDGVYGTLVRLYFLPFVRAATHLRRRRNTTALPAASAVPNRRGPVT